MDYPLCFKLNAFCFMVNKISVEPVVGMCFVVFVKVKLVANNNKTTTTGNLLSIRDCTFCNLAVLRMNIIINLIVEIYIFPDFVLSLIKRNKTNCSSVRNTRILVLFGLFSKTFSVIFSGPNMVFYSIMKYTIIKRLECGKGISIRFHKYSRLMCYHTDIFVNVNEFRLILELNNYLEQAK